jgi:hypothetical protein
MKWNTLTLHVYLYFYNSFPFEAKMCTLYRNKYYLYDKEYCSEHINILNRLYILTSYLMKLVIHFDIILPSVSLSTSPLPFSFACDNVLGKYISSLACWWVLSLMGTLTCRTHLRMTIISPLHFPSYSFRHTLLRLYYCHTFYISEHLSLLCAPSEEWFN